MIPKIIHYCWFGRNPLPPLAVKCISSWKKCFPDYEIEEWNEDNFDVGMIPYTKEAYAQGKYAFVSDYARFWILYHYGGLYFDTDVEVIKPMNEILARGAFMGCEKDAGATDGTLPSVAPGLGLGVNPGLGLYREMLDLYATLHFVRPDGSLNMKTVVNYTTEVLCHHGLRDTQEIQNVAGIWIYPKEYFCPIDYETQRCVITERTCSIHHYAASWHSEEDLYMLALRDRLGFLPRSFSGLFARFVALVKFRGFIAAIGELGKWIRRRG